MKPTTVWSIVGIGALVAVTAAVIWWKQSQAPERAAPPPPPSADATPAPPAPTEPAVKYPIERARPTAEGAQAAASLPPLEQSDKPIQDILSGLLGRQSVRKFLQVDGFVRHVVATIDNLPSNETSVRLWPVRPMPGTLMAEGRGDTSVLSPKNDQRYAAFVQFVEKVDTGKAVSTYVQLYPLFQQAYVELGYPNGYFNDRLVEVIDHLLETPEVPGPIVLSRPEVMYLYADSELEERSAGQKILIRMGAENAARIKAKLRDIRQQVTGS